MRTFIFSVSLFVLACSNPNSNDPFENNPPQIVNLVALPDSVEFNASLLVFCSACDPDDQELSYHWSSEFGTISGTDSLITYIAPEFSCQPWIICTVSDTYGAEDKDSVRVFVVE